MYAIAHTVLTPDMGIPTGIFGPLPKGTVGLIIGRSSWTTKGLSVSPGVIDADYTGEIKIMAHAPSNIISIPTDQRIAQLVLLPLHVTGKTASKGERKAGGFGSSDVYWVQSMSAQRPKLDLFIEGKKFSGILDTGAHVSVIAEEHWPQQWPKQEAYSALRGTGQTKNLQQSSGLLHWKDSEGHEGDFQPFTLPRLPVNLWGRDIMQQMGVYIFAPNQIVSDIMMNQGLLAQQGLGKDNQGTCPNAPIPRPARAG